MSLLGVILVVLAAIVCLLVAFALWARFSPWPRVLMLKSLTRLAGADEAPARATALRTLVTDGVSAQLDLRYAEGDRDARFDLFRPQAAGGQMPAIVWVHGGGWTGGTKDDMREYLQILASYGYATVGVEYSHAPRRHHPEQARQVNAALAHLRANAAQLGIDPEAIVLAGDSAGAQIAAQVAAATVDPGYAAACEIEPALDASQLRGTVLMCGAFEFSGELEPGRGKWIVDTVLWAYSGVKQFRADPQFGYASVARHVTADFPPTLISAGNGDELVGQSQQMAAALRRQGVETEALFFDDHEPPLPHEYHLDLPATASELALERIVAHARRCTRPDPTTAGAGIA